MSIFSPKVITCLRPGVVAIAESGETYKKFFGLLLISLIYHYLTCIDPINGILVSSGTVTVNQDSSVQIIAEEAFPLEQLDIAVCSWMNYRP